MIDSFDTSESFKSLISLESPKSLLLSLWTLVLLSLCPDVFISKQESEFFEITVSHESLELVLLWVKYGRDDISVGMAINVVDEGVAMGVTNGRAEGVPMGVAAEGVALGLGKGEAIDISVAEGVPMGLAEGVPMGVTEGFTMGPAEDVVIDISVGVAEGVALAVSEGVPMGLAEGVLMGVTEGFTMGPAEEVAIDISVGVTEGMAEGVALAEGVNMDTFVRNNFLKKVFDLR